MFDPHDGQIISIWAKNWGISGLSDKLTFLQFLAQMDTIWPLWGSNIYTKEKTDQSGLSPAPLYIYDGFWVRGVSGGSYEGFPLCLFLFFVRKMSKNS